MRWKLKRMATAALAVAAFCGFAAWMGALIGSRRQPLPWPAIERARAALHRARVEAAAEPELAGAVESGDLLERRVAEAGAARLPGYALLPSPSPSRSEIERLAHEAQAAAWRALHSAWTHERRSQEEIVVRRAEIEDKLTSLGAELEQLAADRGLRTMYQRASLEAAAAGPADRRGDLAAVGGELDAAARDLAMVEERLSAHHARLRDPALLGRWRRWVEETVAESRARGGKAVVIDKLERRCLLVDGGHIVASYPAELGRNGFAVKLFAGDAATPEGRYHVVEKRDPGATLFHRALLLDYPSAEDWRAYNESRRRGQVPAGRGIGGSIEIHGHGGKWINWTNGCIALRDAHIDNLFAAVDVGTPVTIVGTYHDQAEPGGAAPNRLAPGGAAPRRLASAGAAPARLAPDGAAPRKLAPGGAAPRKPPGGRPR